MTKEREDKCDGVDSLTCRMASLAYDLRCPPNGNGTIQIWHLCRNFKDFYQCFADSMRGAEAEWDSYKNPDGTAGWRFRVFDALGDNYGSQYESPPSLTVDFPAGFRVNDVTVTDNNTRIKYKLVRVENQNPIGIDSHWYQSGFDDGSQEMATYLKFAAEEHIDTLRRGKRTPIK